MKNRYLKILFVLLVFCSCTEDDSPFNGTDNYIRSFKLEKNNLTYIAKIVDNKLKLTIPENVSLKGAKVSFELSELSTIFPEPNAITDWSDNVSFLVSSYNKLERKYIVEIEKSGVVSNGDVKLLTNKDVENFQKSGVTKIIGNLIIGGIDSLKPLLALTEVTKDIVINDSLKSDSLTQLSNIQKVGNIYIGTYEKTFSPKKNVKLYFENLTQIGNLVINSAKTKSLHIPKLKTAFNLFVNSDSIETISLNSLEEIYGEMHIKSVSNGSVKSSNKELKELNFENLLKVHGSILINKLDSVKHVNFSKLNSVGNDFKIEYLKGLKSINCNVLNEVSGELKFYQLDNLKTIELPELIAVGGFSSEGSYSKSVLNNINLSKLLRVESKFMIKRANLKSLVLPELTSVSSKFELNSIDSLVKLNINKLNTCKEFEISSTKILSDIDLSKISNLENVNVVSAYMLENLTLPKVLKNISLNGGSYAMKFPNISGLDTVSSEFSVTNYKLEKILIPSVKKIGIYSQTYAQNQKELILSEVQEIEEFELSLTSLTTLKAPKLKKVKILNFSNLWNLETCQLFQLSTIEEKFVFKGASGSWGASNCKVSNLNDFSALTSVGAVEIKYCGNLNDFSGLKNSINSISEDNWNVQGCMYNPSLQDMKDGNYVGK
jgi:hypothetical protein